MSLLNDLTEGIASALVAEFGPGCRVYPENQKQGFEAPCFFVQCVSPTSRLFLGMAGGAQRHFRENPFCIQYFPEELQAAREETCEAAERMAKCLEWIVAGGDAVRGSKMHWETVDDVLCFFVSYDLFTLTRTDEDGMDGYALAQSAE